jgi:hypothetical protein
MSRWYQRSSGKCHPDNQLDVNDQYFFWLLHEHKNPQLMQMVFKEEWKKEEENYNVNHNCEIGSWWLSLTTLFKKRIVDYIADLVNVEESSHPILFNIKVNPTIIYFNKRRSGMQVTFIILV